MAKPPAGTSVESQVQQYRIDRIRWHLLLCSGPECVDAAAGEAAWGYLKRRIAELKLNAEPHEVYRTKCHCLRVCTGGPILVVYPDGIWYRSTTPEVLERVLQEHVLGGKPVREFVIAEPGKLPNSPSGEL